MSLANLLLYSQRLETVQIVGKMKQYPHFLFIHSIPENTQDDNGNWIEAVVEVQDPPVEPAPEWLLHSICREETNGKGATINGIDGSALIFSSTIYLPKSATRIKEGTEVTINEASDNSGFERIKKQVLKFEVGQLNCRIWL